MSDKFSQTSITLKPSLMPTILCDPHGIQSELKQEEVQHLILNLLYGHLMRNLIRLDSPSKHYQNTGLSPKQFVEYLLPRKGMYFLNESTHRPKQESLHCS